MALLSIEGLYNYDSTLFNDFTVPKIVDKDTAIMTICNRCRELELLYPDLDFLKQRIKIWSKKNQLSWEKLAATLNLDYNPIENYDRKEEWSENRTDFNETESKRNSDRNGTNKTTNNLNNNYNYSDSHQNTAFNGGLKDYEKEYGSNTTRNTGTQSFNENESNTETSNVTDNGTGSNNHEGRIHGNIGVTTTQQMIEEERRIAMFNIYDEIAESFASEFCLLVY